MRLTLLALVLLLSAIDVDAQVASPAGVTRHYSAEAYSGPRDTPPPVLALQADASHKSPLWQWALVGAAAGGATGAVVGARSVARTNDAFFPQLAIGYGLGIGALGGAATGVLLGAIYNGVAHRDGN